MFQRTWPFERYDLHFRSFIIIYYLLLHSINIVLYMLFHILIQWTDPSSKGVKPPPAFPFKSDLFAQVARYRFPNTLHIYRSVRLLLAWDYFPKQWTYMYLWIHSIMMWFQIHYDVPYVFLYLMLKCRWIRGPRLQFVLLLHITYCQWWPWLLRLEKENEMQGGHGLPMHHCMWVVQAGMKMILLLL